MTREEMFDNIIRKFGFEAEETIRFANYLDKYNTTDKDKLLKIAYHFMMTKKIS
jgi:hypothetical protein